MQQEEPEDDLTPIEPGEGTNPAGKSETGNSNRRVRKRVKIRKKIRIKKKPSSKKKFRKLAERAFWFLLIAAFVVSLIIMLVELDIKDDKFKQQRKRTTTGRIVF